ncbi:MAG: LytTR family transcriptional regulator DNA-binding domain-containing protein, partial [Proteobacteria bacterium]|nr:LytTR family transcriptional regulator DNA-binding domain-containing protein [Pseudomonadota bacterium]
IEIFFEKEELIRVRKNYFVNPNAVIGVNKISKNSYELLTRQKNSIPIGPTYLAKARSTFPQLFSSITK